MKRIAILIATSLAASETANSQTYHDLGSTIPTAVVPLVGCPAGGGSCAGPVSTVNPLPVSGTFSAALSGFSPASAYATPLAVSTVSARTALPAGTTVVIYNVGTSAAFVQLGSSNVAATTSADVIQPNSWLAFYVGSNSYLAAVTASGATVLNISGGTGLPTGGGGGSGSGGSVPTGGAGAPSANVVSVQGVPGGTPAPVSLSSLPSLAAGSNAIGSITVSNFPASQTISASALPLPTGAASAANQTNVQSSPGASASTAITIQGSANGVAVPVTGALSASVGGFAPGGAYVTPLTVTGTSANTALPAGTAVAIYNTGANPAYVRLGGPGVTATTSNDMVQAGGWLALTVGANSYLAAITASGTTSLNISGGTGLLTGSAGGGASGGSVTIGSPLPNGSNTIGAVTQASGPWTENQTQLGGAALGAATAWGTAPTGNVQGVNADVLSLPSLPSGANTIGSVNIAGTLPAFASTPTVTAVQSGSWNIGNITGSVSLPSGAATAANQTSVESAPGASQTTAVTIQGNASGIAVPVTISGTPSFVLSSAPSLTIGNITGLVSLPTGAATSANQPSNLSLGAAYSGSTGNLSLGATSTGAPLYSAGQANALSLTTAGGLRVDGSNTVQPVSGFLPGLSYASPLPVSTSSANVALPTGSSVVVYNTGAVPAYVKLGVNALVTATTSNDVVPAGGFVTLGVGNNTYLAAITASGTTSLNLSGGSGLLAGASGASSGPVAQGSTSSGQSGSLVQGAVTSSAPTYTSGQTNPLSLDTSGNLRVNVATGSLAVTTYDSGAIRVSTTPAASAHSAGTSVGGLLTIPIARVNGGSGIVTSSMIWTSWGSTQTYVLRVWQKNPTSTTCTDGSAFASNTTDDANLIGPGPISLLLTAPANTTGDPKTYAYLAPLSWDYKNSDGTASPNVYACLVTNGSDTPGASATLSVTMSGPQN